MRRSYLQPLLRWRLRRYDIFPVRQRQYVASFDRAKREVERSEEKDDAKSTSKASTMTPREQYLWSKLLQKASFDDNLSKIDATDDAKAAELAEKLPAGLKDMASSFAEKMRYKKYIDDVRNRSFDDSASLETDKMSRLRQLRTKEHNRIVKLIEKSKSDYALWMVLQQEVFTKVSAFGDVPTRKSVAKKNKTQSKVDKEKKIQDVNDLEQKTGTSVSQKESTTEDFNAVEIIGPNYSKLLVIALNQYSQKFPSSLFPFAILPEVKKLGPRSYALAASTDLYNKLIQTTWEVYGQYERVIELLEEMERVGIDFNWVTLEVVRLVTTASMRGAGSSHDIVRVVHHMQHFSEGLQKLKTWRDFIRNRLENEAMREVNEQIMAGSNSQLLIA